MKNNQITEETIICPYCLEDYGYELPLGFKDNDIYYCDRCEHEFKVKKNKNTYTTKLIKK